MKNKKTIVSLFSGCGGLDLGFHDEGYKVLWANDFVQDLCDTFKNNLNAKTECQDINLVDIKNVPKANLVIGGPPCQSFSLAGKRNPNDLRGGMVWSYMRIIEHVKPKVFLFENVLGLRSAKNSKGGLVIDDLKKSFGKLGYTVNVSLLNAADYGVPQRRKRVFIMGSLNGDKIEAPKPTHSESGKGNLKKWVSAEEALSDLPKPSVKKFIKYRAKPKSEYQELMRKNSDGIMHHHPPYHSPNDKIVIEHVKPGGNYMDVPDEVATKRILNFKKTGGRTTTYGKLHPKRTPYTINTHFNRPNVGCNIHYKDPRLITIREAMRIQSFPDNFNLSSSNKRNFYLQVGNAVPPLLAKAWAKHLKKYL